MGDRVKRLLEVHIAHIQWLLVLASLVHQYYEIRELISCPPSLSEFSMFVCNFQSVFTQILFSMIRKRILLAWETRQLFCNLHTV